MQPLRFSRRFGLKSLLGLVAIAAFASLSLSGYLQTRPPIQRSYSPTELRKHLRDGRPVLVTVDADWAINPTNRPRYMSAKVSQQIRKLGIVTMIADWTASSQEVDDLLGNLNRNVVPALALFSPEDPENPIVLPANASDSQILAAVDSLMSD